MACGTPADYTGLRRTRYDSHSQHLVFLAVEMKNKIILLIVSVNLAALVLLTIFFPHLMISPGNLIDAHAELATDCFACHTSFIGSRPAKCIACHKVEEIGKKTTKGLHIATEKKMSPFISN